MRSRALRAREGLAFPPRLSVAGLVFLRGQDADGRLRELVAERARARPVPGGAGLGAPGEEGAPGARLPLRGRLGPRAPGPRCPDRPRVGPGLEAPRGAAPSPESCGGGGDYLDGGGERVRVRIPCSPELARKWAVACELARRVAGEELPVWACAEAIAAECASDTAFPGGGDGEPGIWKKSRTLGWGRAGRMGSASACGPACAGRRRGSGRARSSASPRGPRTRRPGSSTAGSGPPLDSSSRWTSRSGGSSGRCSTAGSTASSACRPSSAS